MSTRHADEKAKIAAFANTLYPEDTSLSRTMRVIIAESIEKYVAQLPNGNFPPRFQPGEHVEYVRNAMGIAPRRGVVVELDAEPKLHHHLRVRFDDGEERHINPDVMRRIRS